MKYRNKKSVKSFSLILVTFLVLLFGGLVLGYRGTGPFSSLFKTTEVYPVTGSTLPMSDVPELNAAAAAQQAKNDGLSTTAQQQAAKKAAEATVQKLAEQKLTSGDKDITTTKQALEQVAKEVTGVAVTAPTTQQITQQIVEKVVNNPVVKKETTTPPLAVENLPKTTCGSANVPMYPGLTYPSGYAARANGEKCSGKEPDFATNCKYRHCVSWSDDGKCTPNNVVCGDALATDPTKVVVSLGGAYGATTTGAQIPVASTCTTNKGPVPSGTTRITDKGVKEYCLNGLWKAETTLATTGTEYCKTLYPDKNYTFDKNLGQCVSQTVSQAASPAEQGKFNQISKEICEKVNGFNSYRFDQKTQEWKCNTRDDCDDKPGTTLNPTTKMCINTTPSCKDGVFRQAIVGMEITQNRGTTSWIVKNCPYGCNKEGTACNPDTPKAGDLKCSGNILQQFTIVANNLGGRSYWALKQDCGTAGCDPVAKACNAVTGVTKRTFSTIAECQSNMPERQECVEVARSVFARIPKRNTTQASEGDKKCGALTNFVYVYRVGAGNWYPEIQCPASKPVCNNGECVSKKQSDTKLSAGTICPDDSIAECRKLCEDGKVTMTTANKDLEERFGDDNLFICGTIADAKNTIKEENVTGITDNMLRDVSSPDNTNTQPTNIYNSSNTDTGTQTTSATSAVIGPDTDCGVGKKPQYNPGGMGVPAGWACAEIKKDQPDPLVVGVSTTAVCGGVALVAAGIGFGISGIPAFIGCMLIGTGSGILADRINNNSSSPVQQESQLDTQPLNQNANSCAQESDSFCEKDGLTLHWCNPRSKKFEVTKCGSEAATSGKVCGIPKNGIAECNFSAAFK